MNERTAQHLKKWAVATKKPLPDLKRWWYSLNRIQKTTERRRMLAELA